MTEEELDFNPLPVEAKQIVVADIDKINNIDQKELRLALVGVTRPKYMQVIADALVATHWIEEYDEQGNTKRVLRPHVARQQWGAEKAMLLFGDMIEHKEIKHDLGDSTLAHLKGLSVAELKEKAKMILEGKVISVQSSRLNDGQ